MQRADNAGSAFKHIERGTETVQKQSDDEIPTPPVLDSEWLSDLDANTLDHIVNTELIKFTIL
jgi:hypothetical protein